MKVGLVLGAGGVVGASWLVGALEALASETGWDPAEAEHIVGTSAGSVIGALTAAGISPAHMTGYVGGGSLDGVAEAEDRAGSLTARFEADAYRLKLALPPIGPGSWRMALSTMCHPRSHAPSAMLSGWLPRGFVSTAPITRFVERFVDDAWPAHPGFWAVAADYRDGRRVAFGRDGAPPVSVGRAVAASCAIPGFYHPVKVADRRYVDGGICSMSNLDLLRGRGLDLVICLNPTSSLEATSSWSPVERLAGAMRGASGRRLGHEARKLRDEGTEVLLVQPTAEDVRAMGPNLMARDRRVQVMELALRTTARQLRAQRGRVALPGRRRARGRRAATARAA
jgi:NTE family protein